MKITTVRIPDTLYEELWKIHTCTRESVSKIIVRLIKEGTEIIT